MMTTKQWKDIRGRLYRILKTINESPADLGANKNKVLRMYLRAEVMEMIDFVEDKIEGRTDRPY